MGAYGFGTDIFGAASPVTWGSNTTAAAGSGLPGLPADVGLTDQGALATVGGELMGARLYDPVTAGFCRRILWSLWLGRGIWVRRICLRRVIR